MKKEIELKFLLQSKNDFDFFMHFVEPFICGPKSIHRQENFYFDTPALNLRKKGISLRLRKQNDEYLFCVKQSIRNKRRKKNLSVRLEYESALDASIAYLLKQEMLSPIDAFLSLPAHSDEEKETKKLLHRHMKKASKTGLQLIGSLKNLRTVLPIKLVGESIELEFDHASYPYNVESFEIEVEFPSEKDATFMRPALENLFTAARIKTYRTSSKSSRLYKLLYG